MSCTRLYVAGKEPRWLRSVFVNDTTGEVFVPAAACQSEMATVLCACFDGATLMEDAGHSFVPLEWAAREYPDRVELWDLLRRRVKDAAA